ncbi:hypothetical protein [Mucisphaera sp.]|uniref:hypothetical protein n=1 Tax=Mucisphaera sp. TaxID=2913024 RepID=UPI003D0A3CB4
MVVTNPTSLTTFFAQAETTRSSLGFDTPLSLWAWLALATLLILPVLWSYTRLTGPAPLRALAGTCRAAALLLIAFLLAGPQIVTTTDRIEPDRVTLLIDRSLSMALTDAGVDNNAQPLTRDQAARQQLTELNDWLNPSQTDDQTTTDNNRQITALAFAESTTAIDANPQTWPQPTGRTTRIDNALRAAITRTDNTPHAGIVLITDGRSDNPLPTSLLADLEQTTVPIHAIVLGGSTSLTDLALTDVQAPAAAFAGDRIPVRILTEGLEDPTTATARLIDRETGDTLDEAPLETDGTARFLARPTQTGQRTWLVQTTAPDDRIPQNNQREIKIQIVDRPIRVLLVDGYPRWEFRFLKNLLLREQSVELSSLLLSADRGFAQEGDLPIQRFPETTEELETYDLIILGDITPAFFTAEQNQLILDHVGQNAAGLIWIAGQQHTPNRFADSPLTPLLPTASPASAQGVLAQNTTWSVTAATAARTLGLINDDDLAQRRGLFWIQNLPDLKPAAQPLFLASQVARQERFPDALPAAIWMRYGAGQTLYIASDDWWRWRYARGEEPYAAFWLPLIRLAVRDRLTNNQPDEATLRASPAIARIGQPVIITGSGFPAEPPPVTINALDQPNTSARELTLQPEQLGPATRWSTTHIPDTPGVYTLTAGPNGPTAQLTVLDDTPEYRNTQPDRDLLQSLAERTNGRLYELDEASLLAGAIPSRARTVVDENRQPIWSSPLILTLLISLLTAEWITRRAAGLT